MAWKQQPEGAGWVAGEIPTISSVEYKNYFSSTFKTVLICSIQPDGSGNQPFGKFFSDDDGHAEENLIEALKANDWVLELGSYREIVIGINNTPCKNCCPLLSDYLDEVLESYPNTSLVIEAANIYHAKSATDQAALDKLSQHDHVKVVPWNVGLESAQHGSPALDDKREKSRVVKSMKTSDRMEDF